MLPENNVAIDVVGEEREEKIEMTGGKEESRKCDNKGR